MPAQNNRLFWAVEGLGIAPYGSTTYARVLGAQSVGINTSFNLEQVFELGQISIYENIENLPDIEVTMTKVLDGWPLLYHLATRGRATTTLAGRANQRSMVALSLHSDVQDSASGTPITQVEMSGMYVSSLSYTFPVDGNCTESVTLVGNNRIWKIASFTFSGGYLNNDAPLLGSSGGVNRRENVVFEFPAVGVDVNGAANTTAGSVMPTDIPGITSSGTNPRNSDGFFGAAIQSITVSADLGREAINELGHKGPYYRYITFPVEVRCDIEVISKSGDMVGATEAGVITTGVNAGNNLSARTIKVKTQEGTFINLGTNNKLSSVSMGGGEAGGGNQTLTYSYLTYNDLDVQHPQDPG